MDKRMVTYYLNKKQVDKASDYLFCKRVLPAAVVVFAIFLMISIVYLAIGLAGEKECLDYAYKFIGVMAFIILFTICLWLGSRRSSTNQFRGRFENGLIEYNMDYNDEKIIVFSKNGNVTNLSFDNMTNVYNTKECVILKFEKLYLFVVKHDNTEVFIEFLINKWKTIKESKEK